MAEGRRNERREILGRVVEAVSSTSASASVSSAVSASSLLLMVVVVVGFVGAKRSEREPVRRRAMVEVRAMVDTCVEGRPAGGDVLGEELGVRVWMMVPN